MSLDEIVQHVHSLRNATAAGFANVSEFHTLVASRLNDPDFITSVLNILLLQFPNLSELFSQFDAAPELISRYDVTALAEGAARAVRDDGDDRARVLQEVKEEAFREAQGVNRSVRPLLVSQADKIQSLEDLIVSKVIQVLHISFQGLHSSSTSSIASLHDSFADAPQPTPYQRQHVRFPSDDDVPAGAIHDNVRQSSVPPQIRTSQAQYSAKGGGGVLRSGPSPAPSATPVALPRSQPRRGLCHKWSDHGTKLFAGISLHNSHPSPASRN
jgi:hypothetical protein